MRKTPLLLAIATLFAQNAFADKVKLTGEELKEALGTYRVTVGVNVSEVPWMAVSQPGGKRELYWNSFGQSAMWQGEGYVEGDKLCTKYKQRSVPRCDDHFNLGNGSYELWRAGKFQSTYKVLYEKVPVN